MIHVPLWLFLLTVAAKVLGVIRSTWQVYCTRRKGQFTIPLSCMYMGIVSTLVGLLYYSWMREPVGILGHIWTALILINNIHYKQRPKCTIK